MQLPYRSLLFSSLAIVLSSCGLDRSKTQSTADSPRTAPRADGFADATAATSSTDEMCLGVALHGDHTNCDDGDEQVSDTTAAAQSINAATNATPATVNAAPTKAPAPVVVPATTTPPVPPVVVKDPNIVEFHIKAGTGAKPWNTAAETVTVKIGQTLRLINDDTITHRLHTGGAPCPHGENFAAGKTFDCKVTKELDPVANPGTTYDHIAGETALFFVKAMAK